MQRAARLKRELQMLASDPPHGVTCWLVEDSACELEAQVVGQEGTPYHRGVFKLLLHLPERYPFESPKVRFSTPIYHPNIDTSGRICLDILKPPPSGSWKPSMNISSVLTSILLLMAEPNPDDPLMADISTEFKQNRVQFTRTASDWTKKYAIVSEGTAIATASSTAASSGALKTQAAPTTGEVPSSSVTERSETQAPSVHVQAEAKGTVSSSTSSNISRTSSSSLPGGTGTGRSLGLSKANPVLLNDSRTTGGSSRAAGTSSARSSASQVPSLSSASRTATVSSSAATTAGSSTLNASVSTDQQQQRHSAAAAAAKTSQFTKERDARTLPVSNASLGTASHSNGHSVGLDPTLKPTPDADDDDDVSPLPVPMHARPASGAPTTVAKPASRRQRPHDIECVVIDDSDSDVTSFEDDAAASRAGSAPSTNGHSAASSWQSAPSKKRRISDSPDDEDDDITTGSDEEEFHRAKREYVSQSEEVYYASDDDIL